jgi:hypothetical protein
MMKNSVKVGGLAALYMAAAYVAGMVFFLLVLKSTAIVDPAQRLALLVDHQAGIYLMNLVDYVVFGVVLVVLSLALHERLKAGSPALMQVATAIGLIWAGMLIASGMIANVGMEKVVGLFAANASQASNAWLVIDSVSLGLSGNGEILGGLWVLLVSFAALRSGGLPKLLNYLGVLIGAAGLASVVPAFKDLMILFGMGQIVWFAWLGIALLRSGSRPAEQKAQAFDPRKQIVVN